MPAPTMSGPSVAPAAGGAAQQLVIFLHGVGADGNDLIDLAGLFAQRLPHAAFVSPHAPFPFDMAPYGRQWFSLQDLSPLTVLRGVETAAPILNAFIDAELAARGLDDGRLVLVGFSQGTMMSLFVSLRRPAPCAAVVGYSGRLIAPELLATELVSRPPVLLVHGEADAVVPFASLEMARRALEQVKVPVRALARPGLGHGIDEAGLRAGIAFVGDALGV